MAGRGCTCSVPIDCRNTAASYGATANRRNVLLPFFLEGIRSEDFLSIWIAGELWEFHGRFLYFRHTHRLTVTKRDKDSGNWSEFVRKSARRKRLFRIFSRSFYESNLQIVLQNSYRSVACCEQKKKIYASNGLKCVYLLVKSEHRVCSKLWNREIRVLRFQITRYTSWLNYNYAFKTYSDKLLTNLDNNVSVIGISKVNKLILAPTNGPMKILGT